MEKGIQIALRYLENKLTRLINRGVLIKLTQSQNNYSNLHFYCSTLVFNIYFFEFAKLLGGPGPPRPLPTLRHCFGDLHNITVPVLHRKATGLFQSPLPPPQYYICQDWCTYALSSLRVKCLPRPQHSDLWPGLEPRPHDLETSVSTNYPSPTPSIVFRYIILDLFLWRSGPLGLFA